METSGRRVSRRLAVGEGAPGVLLGHRRGGDVDDLAVQRAEAGKREGVSDLYRYFQPSRDENLSYADLKVLPA